MAEYPQLCGWCSCAAGNHTPDRCKGCGHEHAYMRADVLACTLLAQINGKFDALGKATVNQTKVLLAILEELKAEPKSGLVKLH